MLGQGWLPLNDYSTKYNISISTLRRRIRAGSIENQFRDGKYWLKDKPTNRAYQTDREDLASVTSATQTAPVIEHAAMPVAMTPPSKSQAVPTPPISDDARALEMANHLVSELKSAYVLILQEKEEQILLLKEETADLKTLVRILESENQRLKNPGLAEAHGEWLNDSLEP
jgi:hypothetical protein